MNRTRLRPIVQGRLSTLFGCWLGTGLTVSSLALFYTFNAPYTWLVSSAIWSLYLHGYIPMKRKSIYNTHLGAIVGALPPFLGTMGSLGILLTPETILLSAFIFSWQFPHFYGILYENKEDYKKANFEMISNYDEDGSKGFKQILACLSVNTLIVPIMATFNMIHPIFLAPFFYY